MMLESEWLFQGEIGVVELVMGVLSPLRQVSRLKV